MSLALLFNLNNLDAGGGADVTAPTISSATINSAGTSLTFAFSESVVATISTGFTITPTNGGAAVNVSYASGSGTSSLVYTLSRTIKSTETLTYAYTQPGNGIEDTAGNDLASITSTAITNNSTQNAAPSDITLSNSGILTVSGLNAVVGALTTTDPDAGDTFTYSLVVGTGSTNNASFNISGANLRCNDPATLGVGTYYVRIQTQDSATNTYAEAFTITISLPVTSRQLGLKMGMGLSL